MKPSLGVCYYPEHWPETSWGRDAERMADIGIRYVRIGEFSWSRLEPSPGDLQFDWLLRAMDTLHANGLSVVLGTPTATPPRWMIEKWPDMLAVDAEGRPKKFGSRRHYCFSHTGYREESVRIAELMAEAVKEHPALSLWQTDNEYGCHDTVLSYSDAARSGFQAWLASKYEDIDALNTAWGNVFWSMEYSDFSKIDLPNLTVCEASPSHWMDFYRYSSDQVLDFNRAQVQVLRRITPNVPITHNYMTGFTDFDHFAIGEQMQVASWDSYPLGQLQNRLGTSPVKAKQARQGDPDLQAFHHDLYRAVGRGRMWVMEQQPGPVNWAAHNADPLPGMVRLWTWEAMAHGAETVSYFRWRQAPFAQEQMHAGMLRPDDVETPCAIEARKVYDEIGTALPECARSTARCAIVFDYESTWAWKIQPQSAGFSHLEAALAPYRALRQLGQDVDIISSRTADLSAYELVVIPALFTWTAELREALGAYKGELVIGPRSGAKTPDFHIPVPLPPAIPGDRLDLRVARIASLAPDCPIALENGGNVETWFEVLEGDFETLAATTGGQPVHVRSGRTHYLAGLLDEAGQRAIIRTILDAAGLEAKAIPEGLRLRHTQSGTFVFNHGQETHDLKALWPEGEFLLDGASLAPAGVTLVR
ncbi:beta-galactosidase [Devosia pacifica]|uniref:Beta-galactosidase n=1 Tax=Devosia pacifica TaxID=1335967 RepID=A0A918RXI4_9HYPH|nr:beta-galactosidase [Devosia pacifica]GHA16254.1 beta-galactosidase [Devosia pacifica]